MRMRCVLLVIAALIVSACDAGFGSNGSASVGGMTCGGGPSFSPDLLAEPGSAENGADPAAVALRTHLATSTTDGDWLPDAGWIEVARTDADVLYIAPDPTDEGSWVSASVGRDGDAWTVTGWGSCTLQPDVGAGMGIASFRVAPDAALDATTTTIPVLVTERACNSGEDARGRIQVASIDQVDDSVTVVLAVRARGGGHRCPSNPETPFVLELPVPLGDRSLFDGSSVPPRDATVCPEIAMCP